MNPGKRVVTQVLRGPDNKDAARRRQLECETITDDLHEEPMPRRSLTDWGRRRRA